MDINVTINAAGLEEALNNLAAALLESKSGTDADAKETGRRRSRRNKNEKVKDVAEDDPAEETTEETTKEEEPKNTEEDEDIFNDNGPSLTREDVQKRLKEIANAGKTAKIKTLLTSYNVKKFSELPEDKFAEILAKAEAL